MTCLLNSRSWFTIFFLLNTALFTLVQCEEPDVVETKAKTTTPTPPNLLIIMTDEHNLRTLGCYRNLLKNSKHVWGENVNVETPHLDKLASEGAIFQNYNVASPLCTPSRASFMSGLYPGFTGIARNHQPMNDDIVTFAQIIKEKAIVDYHTGYVGKWHLNGLPKPGFNDKSRPFGFDDVRYQYNRGHYKVMEEDENGIVQAYDYLTGKEEISGRLKKQYTTDFLFDKGISFLQNAIRKNKTFALMLSIPDPHGPNVIRPPYDTMFDDMDFELPMTAKKKLMRDPGSPFFSHIREPKLQDAGQFITDTQKNNWWQQTMRNYFGMVKQVDDKIGRVMNLLETRNQVNNTIVVFTSDHGDMLAEHGQYNKGYPYQASASAPLIIRYPGHIKPGKVIKTAYTSTDFAPTILSLMGIDHSNYTFHGTDGAAEILNDALITKIDKTIFTFKEEKWVSAFDSDGHKLILSKSDAPILFHHKRDPHELVNFIYDDSYIEKANELKRDLVEAMKTYQMYTDDATYYVDKPACYDSRDAIAALELQHTCNEMRKPNMRKKCDWPAIHNTCPVTCRSCCKDSEGFMFKNGDYVTCSDVAASKKEYCADWRSSNFCPIACEKRTCESDTENTALDLFAI